MKKQLVNGIVLAMGATLVGCDNVAVLDQQEEQNVENKGFNAEDIDISTLIEPETITENDYICPQCGNKDKLKMNITIRLCGYLGSLSERPTVDNKMKEMHTRVVHCGEQ